MSYLVSSLLILAIANPLSADPAGHLDSQGSRHILLVDDHHVLYRAGTKRDRSLNTTMFSPV